MSTFEKILTFLRFEMERPGNYSPFHIAFLILTIAITIFLIWKFRDCDEKTARRILLGAWITLVILEVYKQVIFSYDGNAATPWSYPWYIFPFQLCSNPLYVFPFAAFLKKGPAKDAVVSFLATFSVFGGLAVMFYPNDVFTSVGGVNVQTMIHHGTQVAVGLFLAARHRRNWSFKFFLKGVIPFALLSAIAIGLNEFMHVYFTNNGIDAAFNMFYISRHHPCTLPVLSAIYPKVPYPAFLILYLVGFVLVAGIIFGAEAGCIRLARRSGRKEA